MSCHLTPIAALPSSRRISLPRLPKKHAWPVTSACPHSGYPRILGGKSLLLCTIVLLWTDIVAAAPNPTRTLASLGVRVTTRQPQGPDWTTIGIGLGIVAFIAVAVLLGRRPPGGSRVPPTRPPRGAHRKSAPAALKQASEAPSSEEAALTHAEALFQQHRYHESAVAYQRVLDTNPSSGRALYGLGLNQLALNHYRESAQLFQKSLVEDPKNANSYYYLGQIAERGKQQDTALAMYRQALEIDPAHAGALARVKELTEHKG